MSKPADNQRWKVGFLSVVVSVATLIGLVTIVELPTLVDRVASAKLLPLGLAGIAAAGSVLLRALRLHGLLSGRFEHRGYLSTTRLQGFHQVLFVLLPSGFGDGLFPWMAKVWLGHPYVKSTAAMVVARLQDLAILSTIVAVAVSNFALRDILAPGFAVLLSTVVLLVGLQVAYQIDAILLQCTRWLRTTAQYPWMSWTHTLAIILTKFEVAIANQPTSLTVPHQRTKLLALSVSSWLLVAIMQMSLFQAFSAPIAFWEALFVVAAVNFVGAAAVFSLAGLGITEAGLTGILIYLGWQPREALEVALIVRPFALVLVVMVSLGIGLIASVMVSAPTAKPRDERVGSPTEPLSEPAVSDTNDKRPRFPQ